jgi:hypothetical protein
MAIVRCQECWKDISSEARSCPHCGYSKSRIRKPLLITLGVIGAGFALMMAFGLSRSGESKYDYRYSLERQLKEPSSAEYRNDSLYYGDDGKIYYCGEVNAKNSFGGYAGFVRFMGNKGGFLFENGGDADKLLLRVGWPNNCRNEKTR